jgi:hypothetical protein
VRKRVRVVLKIYGNPETSKLFAIKINKSEAGRG